MADWQRTLNMVDVWDSSNIPLIAKTAAERLAALAPLKDEHLNTEKLNIIEELNMLAEDPSTNPYDFDQVWEKVYNWADTPLDSNWNGKKVCWIKTF